MVISTFACAALQANNIKPANATRKERILPMASGPCLQRRGSPSPGGPYAQLRLWFQRARFASLTLRVAQARLMRVWRGDFFASLARSLWLKMATATEPFGRLV